MPRLKVTSPSSERIEYEFGDVAVSIGRELDNMIVVDDPLVSRYHAVVSLSGGAWWLMDQDSTHGIWVREKQVRKLLLKDRESFAIGDHKFRFTLMAHGGAAASAAESRTQNTEKRGKNHKQKRGAVATPKAAKPEEGTEKANVTAPAICVGAETVEAAAPNGAGCAAEPKDAATAVTPPIKASQIKISQDVAAPVVTAPVVTEPVVTAPVVTAPVVTAPVVAEPVVTEPVVTAPVVTESVVAESVVAESVVTEPVVTAPVVTAPVVTAPVVTAPVVTAPVVAESAKAAPVTSSADQLLSPRGFNPWVLIGVGVCSLGVILSVFYPFNAAKEPPAKVTEEGAKSDLLPRKEVSAPSPVARTESGTADSIAPKGAVPKTAVVEKTVAPPKSERVIVNPVTEVAMLVPEPRAVELPRIEPRPTVAPPAEPKPPPLPPKSMPRTVAEEIKAEAPPEISRVLFQPTADDMGQQPVISPDLQHVLYLSKAGGGGTSLGNLMLDEGVIRKGVQVATAADLRFAMDGSKWLAFVADATGQRALLLPDRSYLVRGQLQAVLGSRDFSVVAYVERVNEEDALYLNGEKVSSYVHITTPRLSPDGKHWAYVAMKRLDAEMEGIAPGERVVTDAWNGPVQDHISELTLGGNDGGRVAYVAHGRNGAQTLWMDRKVVFEVKPYTGMQISQVTLAPAGDRCAWVVFTREGAAEFHVNDAAPVTADVASEVGGETLFSRVIPTARVLFSEDGRHVAFAAVGKSAVIARDGVVIGAYPSVRADSLTFSPDGGKLAYVALHPLRPAGTGADGVATQPHAAVLQVNDKAMQTVPMMAHKLPGLFPVSLGGFAQFRFSPDAQKLAYIFTPAVQGQDSGPRQELWVDGRKSGAKTQSVEAFLWVSPTALRLVDRDDNSLWIRSLEASH